MGKLKSLATRSITGVVYVGVIVGSILWGKLEVLAWVLAIFAMLGVYEYQTMVRSNQYALFLKIWHSLMAGLPMYIAYEWLSGGSVLLAALPSVAYYLFYLIGEIYRIKRQPAVELGHAFFSHLYISIPLTFLLFAFRLDGIEGMIMLLSIFVTIWLNDTGAYLVGSLIGKHKMIQRVSPNKTWEGTIGGALASLIVAAVFYALGYVGGASIVKVVGFVLLVVFFSTFGDLFESFLKRAYGVKDSGKILPGHGGILDRIDSLLFVAIPAYFYIKLVNLI